VYASHTKSLNSSREQFDSRGVTINRNGPVLDCSRHLSSCFWSSPVYSHTVTEVTTDITKYINTTDRTGCHGVGHTLDISFSTLIPLVGSFLLTCKNRLPYNLYCVGGDVKHCSLTQGLLWLSSLCAHVFSRLTATIATATATGPEFNGKYNSLGLFVDPVTQLKTLINCFITIFLLASFYSYFYLYFNLVQMRCVILCNKRICMYVCSDYTKVIT